MIGYAIHQQDLRSADQQRSLYLRFQAVPGSAQHALDDGDEGKPPPGDRLVDRVSQRHVAVVEPVCLQWVREQLRELPRPFRDSCRDEVTGTVRSTWCGFWHGGIIRAGGPVDGMARRSDDRGHTPHTL